MSGPQEPQPAHPTPPRAVPGPGAYAYPPAVARPNPFVGVPWRDYVTDLAALALLCLSLSQTWTFFAAASSRVEVVVATIVSILSLGVFYVGRSTGWSPRTVMLVRSLANVPYGLVVVFYLVTDAAFALTVGPTFAPRFDIGLGSGLATGLAGVALAVAPRQVESDDASTAPAADGLARAMLWALFGIVVAEQVLATVEVVVLSVRFGAGWYQDGSWVAVVQAVLTIVVTAGLTAGPLWATLHRLGAWRWVLVAVGAASLLGPLVGSATLPGGTLSNVAWGVLSGNGAFAFVAAAAAVALAPAVVRAMRPVEPVRGWFDVARAAWLTIAGAAALAAVSWLLRIALDASQGRGTTAWSVAVLVLFAMVAVAAVVVRATFGGDPIGTRSLAVGVTSAMLVAGCLLVGLGPAHRASALIRAADVVTFAVAFALPALALLALTVPSPVRAFFAAHRPPRPAAAGEQPVAPSHGFTAAQAADPETDLAVLAAIAERAPELRPHVALNPSTYPDLLGWLARLHDPAVDAALAARRS